MAVHHRLIKKLVDTLGRAANCEVTPRWRLPDKRLEDKLRQTFAQFEIQAVVDIGANRGQYRDFLRERVGFSGEIYSFEPDPDLSAELAERAARSDNHWRVFPVALGAQEGQRALRRMLATEFNSFLDPIRGQPQLASSNLEEMNSVVTSVLVAIKTLDQYADEFGPLGRTFVKIDTQGFDLQVLAGAQNTLRKVPALQTEVSFRPLYDGSPSFTEAIAAFQKSGFSVSDFFLIVSDINSCAIEFDCVMVRTPPDHQLVHSDQGLKEAVRRARLEEKVPMEQQRSLNPT
jgi:FkbM family methyltransferase